MMDKLISQQAAIEHWRRIIDATSTDSGYNMGFVDGLEFCISHLSTMPSAQPESEAISKWKKEFREYVDSLDIARDDWKGIIEYIDELPSAQPFNNITMNDVIGNIGGEDG